MFSEYGGSFSLANGSPRGFWALTCMVFWRNVVDNNTSQGITVTNILSLANLLLSQWLPTDFEEALWPKSSFIDPTMECGGPTDPTNYPCNFLSWKASWFINEKCTLSHSFKTWPSMSRLSGLDSNLVQLLLMLGKQFDMKDPEIFIVS